MAFKSIRSEIIHVAGTEVYCTACTSTKMYCTAGKVTEVYCTAGMSMWCTVLQVKVRKCNVLQV